MKVTIAIAALLVVVGTTNAKLVKVNTRENLEDSAKPTPIKGDVIIGDQHHRMAKGQGSGGGGGGSGDKGNSDCMRDCVAKGGSNAGCADLCTPADPFQRRNRRRRRQL